MSKKFIRTVVSIFGGAAVLATALVAPAAFATEILPGVPLNISVTEDLNCAVVYDNEDHGAYYEDTACGTFVTVFDPNDATSWETFGPANVPAGPDVTAYTIVSQTPMSGTGSSGDPFTVTTVVELGTTGLSLTQVDTYVDGDEEWETTITIESDSNVALDPLDVIVYRAADCYFGDDDSGRGVLVQGEAPMCVGGADTEDPTRLIGFWPRTPGSNYITDSYLNVWDVIDSGLPFPDYIMTGEDDNVTGLSWNLTVHPGGSETISLSNILSPSGTHVLNLTAVADSPLARFNSSNGYTVKISNPGLVSDDIDTLTVTLPEGFAYTAGSTTGATTGEPAITTNSDSQQVLTWSGPFAVQQTASTSVHFNVTTGPEEGFWYIDVEGTSSSFAVVSALQTAEIELGDFATLSAVADSATSIPGAMNGYSLNVPEFTSVCELGTYTVILPDEFTYVTGSSTGATTDDPDVDGSELYWDLSGATDCNLPASLHFKVNVGATEGVFTIDASAESIDDVIRIVGVLNGAPITVGAGSDPDPGPGPGPSDSLANTGSGDPVLVFGIGFGVIALGGSILLASARRRQSL